MAVALAFGAAGAAVADPAPSAAAPAASLEPPVAVEEVSVQLFNFFVYIGFDQSPEAQARQEGVLSTISDMGYRNVEAVDYTAFQGIGATQYRTLLDAYGLKVSGLHTSVSMATTDEQWATSVQTALTIGAPFIGAGSTPNNFTTKKQWVAYAEKIDHLGELSRAQGVQYMVHSHDWEFRQVFDGETGYDILQANTSPENVVFELDLYWATEAGADPLDVIESYGDRIELLHVKDLAADGSITTVGEGTIDFAPIFAAAGEDIQYYVIERDPPSTVRRSTPSSRRRRASSTSRVSRPCRSSTSRSARCSSRTCPGCSTTASPPVGRPGRAGSTAP